MVSRARDLLFDPLPVQEGNHLSLGNLFLVFLLFPIVGSHSTNPCWYTSISFHPLLGGSAQDLSRGFSQHYPGCSHLKALLGLEDPLIIWVTHLAVGRRPQSLITQAFPWVCLSSSRCGSSDFPQYQWSKSENKKAAAVPFMTSSYKSHTDTSAIFCSLWTTSYSLRAAHIQWEGELSSTYWWEAYHRI